MVAERKIRDLGYFLELLESRARRNVHLVEAEAEEDEEEVEGSAL